MRPTNRLLYLRVLLAGTLVTASASLAFLASKPPGSPVPSESPRLVYKKGDPDAGASKKTKIGANEYRGAVYTPAIAEFLNRAFPKKDVPGSASIAAAKGWAKLNGGKHSAGTWSLIGPSQADVPGVLNVLGDEAPYIAAGRVTAMALAPNCSEGHCVLYVAAAGGGVWRTDKALHTNPSQKWTYLSSSFATNAIGSLLIDPRDASGNTLYAGTGEPNASGDSEAGVGVYRTTDGGNSWALVPGSDIFFQRAIGQMALDNAGNLLVPIASGVRGIDETDGGSGSSGSTDHPLAPRGLYRQTGSTFVRIFAAPPPTRGSTTVKVDPTHPGFIYVNSFGGDFFGPGVSGGIWRSVDNGATFEQIFEPRDATFGTIAFALERDEFDVTTLRNGATRMYVGAGEGSSATGGPPASFWRSDNADTAATFVSLGGDQVSDYCDGQCWYDNLVYTPRGFPDVVYLLGSFSYPQIIAFGNGKSNGRAVLLSTNAGRTWSDMTQDSDATHAEFTHPDQHAIVTLPGNPLFYWEGNDGGIVESDGQTANITYKCDQRGLDAADVAYCKTLLWRVPAQLANDIDRGFSTLQFQSLSISAQHPKNLIQGGTQDNGTWQNTGNNSANPTWNQIMYGDGGQSAFSVTDDRLRANTFTGQENDANFRNGDPTKWVIIGGKMTTSPEGSQFYPPFISDPHPANARTLYQGSNSVWRSQDWGGDQAFLEANCPEFTTSAFDPDCGDFVKLGAPTFTDLTDSGIYGPPRYGPDRQGNFMSVIQRTPANPNTVWATTGAGRVFVSDDVNVAADSVVWHRIDPSPGTNDPERYPTGVAIDPAKPHHGWVSYSGYNVNTPHQPGHVFEVTWAGAGPATWVDRSYNLPDFPITSIVRDDVTGDLYASSDFGVMKLARNTTSWVVAGSGLPNVEVPNLKIVPGERLLFAATHGRSAWEMPLP